MKRLLALLTAIVAVAALDGCVTEPTQWCAGYVKDTLPVRLHTVPNDSALLEFTFLVYFDCKTGYPDSSKRVEPVS